MQTPKLIALLFCVVAANGNGNGNSKTETFKDDVITRTTHGDIRGLRKSVLGRQVDVYWGIPYAKTPTRFRPPERADAWEEVLEAVSPPPSCPEVPYWGNIPLILQPTTPFDEDCLFLNVWQPRDCPPSGDGEGMAMMVWIHGGSFEWGSTTVPTYDGQVLAATQCVIVATLNYRLGPLGFLSVGDSAPGNVGLLDQVLALQWLHDNADRFGGSPDRITLFGESAGALSVEVHMASPMSRHLFSRAVMQSNAGGKWGKRTMEQNARVARKLARLLDCPDDDDEAMVACLSKVDSAELSRAVVTVRDPNDIGFGIIVDGHFIREPLEDSFRRGEDMKQFDVMVGVTKNDAAFILANAYTPDTAGPDSRPHMPLDVFRQFTEQVVLRILVDPPTDTQLAARLVEYLYVNSSLPGHRDDYHTALENIFLDLTFLCNMYWIAAPFLGSRGVFMYSYDHRSPVTAFPLWMGVVHASELDLVFGRPLDKETFFTDQDRQISQVMMTAWANFAKFGDPNGDSNNLPTEWPALDDSLYPYAVFSAPHNVIIEHGLRYRECTFWNDVYPAFVAGKKGTDSEKGHDEL